MTDLQERNDDEQRAIDQLLAALSQRERQVLTHVIAGRLNKQTANDLRISEKTVKVHRGRMMTKLGMRNVVDLVRFAVHAGLLPEYRLPIRPTAYQGVPQGDQRLLASPRIHYCRHRSAARQAHPVDSRPVISRKGGVHDQQ